MLEKNVEKLLNPVALDLDINIYKIEYVKEKEEYFLRVMIEKKDLTMDLKICEIFSEKINPILDEAKLIENQYYLDVCSPGEDRVYSFDDLNNMLEWYIEIKTNKPYLKDEYILNGNLLQKEEDFLILKVNQKGRIRKIKIQKEDVASIKLAYKV